MSRTFEESYRLGEALAMGFNTKDYAAVAALLTEDAAWVLPSSPKVASFGERVGPAAFVERWKTIEQARLIIHVEQVCVDYEGKIALIFHNWGVRGDKRVEEHLVANLTVVDGKISRLVSSLSDIDGAFAFLEGV